VALAVLAAAAFLASIIAFLLPERSAALADNAVMADLARD